MAGIAKAMVPEGQTNILLGSKKGCWLFRRDKEKIFFDDAGKQNACGCGDSKGETNLRDGQCWNESKQQFL